MTSAVLDTFLFPFSYSVYSYAPEYQVKFLVCEKNKLAINLILIQICIDFAIFLALGGILSP